MDEKLYKFEGPNPRVATNVEEPSNLLYLSGAIFIGSLYLYNKRTFRID